MHPRGIPANVSMYCMCVRVCVCMPAGVCFCPHCPRPHQRGLPWHSSTRPCSRGTARLRQPGCRPGHGGKVCRQWDGMGATSVLTVVPPVTGALTGFTLLEQTTPSTTLPTGQSHCCRNSLSPLCGGVMMLHTTNSSSCDPCECRQVVYRENT